MLTVIKHKRKNRYAMWVLQMALWVILSTDYWDIASSSALRVSSVSAAECCANTDLQGYWSVSIYWSGGCILY